MLIAVDGVAARKTVQQIAVDMHGADRIAADWEPDSAVRAQVRRLVTKARGLMQGGYLDLAAGRRPRN